MTRLEAIAQRRSVPGVLLFAGSGDLLFMNHEAEVISHQIQGESSESLSSPALPSEIRELCVSLQSILEGPETDPIQADRVEGPLELRRITGNVESPVLLRGFPLSSSGEKDEACMLILMEKLGRERRVVPGQVKDQYRLTDREVEIVRYISEGWTNKEIAKHLDISEHTVKEHVRHLLKKTKSTTRTGILANLFQDT
ncbi:MAG: hypothetical protein KC563_08610 [Nitrospira sp.]|nr:hypothetical protein [Nitrospira sp.]MCA9480566.1 hypothetical protein [Nitrospira sp.]MCB9711855.1 hypothetical protein [Nitrospiraceae bacterium]